MSKDSDTFQEALKTLIKDNGIKSSYGAVAVRKFKRQLIEAIDTILIGEYEGPWSGVEIPHRYEQYRKTAVNELRDKQRDLLNKIKASGGTKKQSLINEYEKLKTPRL